MIEKNILYYTIVNKKNIKLQESSGKLETKQAQIVLKSMLDYFGIKLPKINTSKRGKQFFLKIQIYFSIIHIQKII